MRYNESGGELGSPSTPQFSNKKKKKKEKERKKEKKKEKRKKVKNSDLKKL